MLLELKIVIVAQDRFLFIRLIIFYLTQKSKSLWFYKGDKSILRLLLDLEKSIAIREQKKNKKSINRYQSK